MAELLVPLDEDFERLVERAAGGLADRLERVDDPALEYVLVNALRQLFHRPGSLASMDQDLVAIGQDHLSGDGLATGSMGWDSGVPAPVPDTSHVSLPGVLLGRVPGRFA